MDKRLAGKITITVSRALAMDFRRRLCHQPPYNRLLNGGSYQVSVDELRVLIADALRLSDVRNASAIGQVNGSTRAMYRKFYDQLNAHGLHFDGSIPAPVAPVTGRPGETVLVVPHRYADEVAKALAEHAWAIGVSISRGYGDDIARANWKATESFLRRLVNQLNYKNDSNNDQERVSNA